MEESAFEREDLPWTGESSLNGRVFEESEVLSHLDEKIFSQTKKQFALDIVYC